MTEASNSPFAAAAPRRRGFTIVELMMVISIIALLMALLLPAIQAARESARRAQCAHKMRQIGLAMAQFESRQQSYPGWRHYPFGATDAVSGQPVTFSTSWFPQLLPYLGRDDLFDPNVPGSWKYPIISSGVPLGSVPNLRDLNVCPSDAVKMASNSAVMSYVGNSGRRDRPASATAPADWRSNGVFLDLLFWRTRPANRVKVTPCDTSFIRGGDGLATTLLLSENYDAGRWYELRESREGFIFYPPGTRPNHRINSPTRPGGPSFLNARPASYHPGGVNVVFASGNGRFLNEDIAYPVYCALMTPRGQSAREPGTTQASPSSITNQPKITFE